MKAYKGFVGGVMVALFDAKDDEDAWQSVGRMLRGNYPDEEIIIKEGSRKVQPPKERRN